MAPVRGFTLIELLITITVVALLVLATAPLAKNWVYRSQTHSGSTVLQEAYSVAKALALENPTAVAVPGTAAAGLSIATDGTTTTLLVCTGSAAAATCSASGTAFYWSATYSGLVTTSVSSAVNSATGATTTTQTAVAGTPITIDFDDRGEALPLNTNYTYTITRGTAPNTNSESYALY